MSPAVKRVLVSPQEPLAILFLVLLFSAEAFAVTVVAIFIGVVLFRAVVLSLTVILMIWKLPLCSRLLTESRS